MDTMVTCERQVRDSVANTVTLWKHQSISTFKLARMRWWKKLWWKKSDPKLLKEEPWQRRPGEGHYPRERPRQLDVRAQ